MTEIHELTDADGVTLRNIYTERDKRRLGVGLVVSVFQAATQINEMTLSFIPKLLGVFIAIVISGPWILQRMVDYTQRIFTNIPLMVG